MRRAGSGRSGKRVTAAFGARFNGLLWGFSGLVEGEKREGMRGAAVGTASSQFQPARRFFFPQCRCENVPEEAQQGVGALSGKGLLPLPLLVPLPPGGGVSLHSTLSLVLPRREAMGMRIST